MGFLDRIVSKAPELGSDAAREASKATETTPIKLSISGLHGSRQKLLEQLGKEALALYQEKQIAHPSLEEPVSKIVAVDQEISAKEAQLLAIEEKYKDKPAS